MVEESNITMSLEWKNRSWIVGTQERWRKQHLLPPMSLKSILKKRVARSCWKNPQKSKLDMGLRNTSQNYEVTTCHAREKELDWYEWDEKLIFTGRINEELWSFISTINSKILRENFRWNITQDNSNDEIDGFKTPHS